MTFVLISRPERYAAMLLKHKTLSANVAQELRKLTETNNYQINKYGIEQGFFEINLKGYDFSF